MTGVTGSIEGSVGAPEPVVRRAAGIAESRQASRRWWDAQADAYQREHGPFLGRAQWIWGPEGLDEADAELLGPVSGRRFLEVGSGAGAGARWLATRGAWAVGLDLSERQLRHSHGLDRTEGVAVPVVCGDAARLPFADASFDGAGSAYGALPFVADAAMVLTELTRVLRRGAPWVFSVTHPLRWSFPDDPGQGGLTAARSYFDRRSYVEQDESGVATYVEHHRTLGDWVTAITGSGFVLEGVVEPPWPDGHDQAWGAWSPLRGRVLPGTAIFCCRLP